MKRGRPGYGEDILHRCAIVHAASGTSVIGFVRRLKADAALREECGLDGSVPSQATFSRHFKTLGVFGSIVVPERWLGRKSKFGNWRAPAYHRIAEAIDVHVVTVGDIFSGKKRPYPATADRFAAIGIEVPTYNQSMRVFKRSRRKKCRFCKKSFKCNRSDARWCSIKCGMANFHRRVSRERLCNSCGKKADSKRFTWSCRRHEDNIVRSQKRSAMRRRQRFLKEGLCISCSLLSARDGLQLCLLCAAKGGRRWAARSKRQLNLLRQQGLITVREAARALSCTPAWIRRLIARGRFVIRASGSRPARGGGWHYWVSADEVERYRTWSANGHKQTFVALPDPSKLLLSLRQLLPVGLPDTVKDDAVGAMTLDILEGRAELSAFGDPDAQAMMIPNYVKEAYKAQGDPFGTVSLDKPLSEDGGVLSDLLEDTS